MSFWLRFAQRPQSVWLRKALFQIHLWTGVGVGLYVFAISISGSAIVFRNDVYKAVPTGPRPVSGTGPMLSKPELMQAAERLFPKYQVSYVWESKKPNQSVEIWLDRNGTRMQRLFDPYTGKDLGEARPYSIKILAWLGELHVDLLGGATGRIVNGVLSIVMTVLAATGLVVWWPGIKNWRRSLMVNPKATWKRINWDLHSAIGLWTFAFVFMWALTGIYLCFPAPFQAWIHRVAPLDYYRPISLEMAPTPSVTVDAQPDGRAKGRRFRPPPHYSRGDLFIRWIYYLHFGNFAGWRTKAAWVALGLVPPLLFITGLIMWWNRVLSREARRLRSRETAPALVAEVQ